jgi:peroxiredoxin
MTEPSESLLEQTEKAKMDFINALPEEQRQVLGAAMERLMASDSGTGAKGVGDMAPDFALPRAVGGTQRLTGLLAQGPVVLSFYRGGWCPFCNLEFRALQARLPEMRELGATLVGVSPETPDQSLSTREKQALEFEVLSDVGNRVARDYGLVMIVDEAVRPLYLQWGIDIPSANGDDSYELPLPATYVIDSAGYIRAAHVDRDYTRRMEPEDIVAALQSLG